MAEYLRLGKSVPEVMAREADGRKDRPGRGARNGQERFCALPNV